LGRGEDLVKHETVVAEPHDNKGRKEAQMLAPSETEVEQPVLPGIEEPDPPKRPKRRRSFAPFIVLLIAAILGFGAWRFLWSHGAPEKRAPEDVQSVGAANVAAGQINETIAGLGTVTPLATITV
jgi:hypothetical protein